MRDVHVNLTSCRARCGDKHRQGPGPICPRLQQRQAGTDLRTDLDASRKDRHDASSVRNDMGGHIILLAGLTIGVLVVGGALLYEEIEEQRERSRRARVASDARPQQHGNARTSARRHDIPLRKRQVGHTEKSEMLIAEQLSIGSSKRFRYAG